MIGNRFDRGRADRAHPRSALRSPARRTVKYLRRSVLPENLCFDLCGSDSESPAEVNAKAPAVEKRAGAQNAIVLGQITRQVCERVGRIGHDEQHGFWSNRNDPRHNISIDFSVLVEEPKSSLWVAAISCTAGFLGISICN